MSQAERLSGVALNCFQFFQRFETEEVVETMSDYLTTPVCRTSGAAQLQMLDLIEEWRAGTL